MNIIPKVIHYFWFGNNPKPEIVAKCIASWKKYMPDWEIKEWNESNYDVQCCRYVEQAYKAKKWAFVSDYARFDILNRKSYTKGYVNFTKIFKEGRIYAIKKHSPRRKCSE